MGGAATVQLPATGTWGRRMLVAAITSGEVLTLLVAAILSTAFFALFRDDLSLPFWSPVLSLAAGAIGSAVLVHISLHDPEQVERMALRLLRDEMLDGRIEVAELRALVIQLIRHRATLERHRLASGIRAGSAGAVLGAADRWLAGLKLLIRVVEPLQEDWREEERRRQALLSRIDDLERLLGSATSPQTAAQLRETIASRKLELRALEELAALFERTLLRLEHAASTLKAMSSRLLLIGAEEGSSFDAKLLTQDIEIEIAEVEAVVRAVQRVQSWNAAGADAACSGLRQEF